MTPDRRQRVAELFEAALDRDAESAAQWIAREAADDPAVRDEALSLLASHSRAGAFLERPIAESAPDLLADDEPLAAGTTIGAYTIVREIGRGGMGHVYLASDARLGRSVALKALAPHLVRDPTHRERLRREARAAASLSHPGICTVFALEEVEGALYIATEFVDGRTLRDEIDAGPRPSVGEIVRTARETAAALAAAHARGIVHRDLKPENVMRARDGSLKILDFGLARLAPPDDLSRAAALTFATDPGLVVGTPAYMAPEQINGGEVDARADVFAMGVLLYEFACGIHPFGASSPLAIVARVLDSDARPIESRRVEIPDGLAAVIARCLQKAPADRFRSAAEIVEALRAADRAAAPARHSAWWRTHQIAITAIYLAAAILSWQMKEWVETPVTVAIFLALGVAATIGGVLRGHLVFTERMNRARLAVERRRTTRLLTALDVAMAALLAGDAAWIAPMRALPAVFALSAAAGLALATFVLEPATTAAAFGEDL